MEIDLTKIKNLSKERADENWDFRTFLKSYDIKHLDLMVRELFEQLSEAIDCTTCGNCCKKMQPILKKKDISKLSKSINIKPDQFIEKYVGKDEDGESILNQLPCPFLKENICAHYDSRPADCVSYPHLHKKEFVFRLIGVVNNYSICPIVFYVYEALKSKLKSEFIDFQEDFGDFQYY